MFTGIISHIGTLKNRHEETFTFQAVPSLAAQLKLGSSIAINGCCLTVIEKIEDNLFSVQVMAETIKKTTFNDLQFGDIVNLELPLSSSGRFEGHIVQGHIDSVATVGAILKEEKSSIIRLNITEDTSQYIVKKGSVAVNGVSLTVIDTEKKSFSVGIIPYTFHNTNFQHLKKGSWVNLEVDIIAKYVKRLLNQKI